MPLSTLVSAGVCILISGILFLSLMVGPVEAAVGKLPPNLLCLFRVPGRAYRISSGEGAPLWLLVQDTDSQGEGREHQLGVLQPPGLKGG